MGSPEALGDAQMSDELTALQQLAEFERVHQMTLATLRSALVESRRAREQFVTLRNALADAKAAFERISVERGVIARSPLARVTAERWREHVNEMTEIAKRAIEAIERAGI
jgi:hypothetical protein